MKNLKLLIMVSALYLGLIATWTNISNEPAWGIGVFLVLSLVYAFWMGMLAARPGNDVMIMEDHRVRVGDVEIPRTPEGLDD